VPTLTPRGSGPVPSPKQEIGSRVFCASGRDEPSYQCVLGGHWHGAFTWAFTRALEQWKTAPSGQFRQSTVSHVELLFRARMLLEALSVHQHPVLVDRIGNLPVFLHGGDAASAASADPNTDRHSGQIDPVNGFAYYRFFDADRNALAEIIATGTADDTHKSGLEAGWEYWKIGGDRFKSSEYATVFVSKVASGEWHSVGQVPFTAADADFSCPVGMPWSAFSGPAASYLKQSEGYTHGGFDVDVSLQNGLWSGQITFYRDTLNGLLFGTIVSGSQRSLTMGSYLPAQQCSITAQDLRQPLRSGNRYVLFDLAKNVSIHKAHETNGGYYATTDQDGGSQPQTLELVGGSPTGATPIRSGDEIYIRSVEAKLTGQYLRPQGSGANDLWYQTGSTPGQVHTWIIRSFPRDERPDGAVISLGDLVTFENKEQRGRYMGANQGDGYLSTTGLLRAWTLSAS
jgi:hypothetical protein